ncbi:hypothetical protein RB200_26435 [Streptomyces sp. PmtG]
MLTKADVPMNRRTTLLTTALTTALALGTLTASAVAEPRPDAPRASALTASHPGPSKAVQPKRGDRVPVLPSAPLKGLPTLQEAKKKGLLSGPVKSKGGVKAQAFPDSGCATPPQGSGYHDYLKPGECLTPGKYIAVHVPNNLAKWYELWVQGDGNVVLYDHNFGTYQPFWETDTRGRNVSLWMQRDGNVVVYDGNGSPLWSLGTSGCGGHGAWLRVQADMNLVLYDRDWGPLWARFNGPSTRPC